MEKLKSEPRSIRLQPVTGSSDKRTACFNLLVDLTQTRKTITRDLNAELRQFLPYRNIDPLLHDALELKTSEGISYPEASRRMYGRPRRADAIRYLHNRLAGVGSCRES